MPGPKLHLRSPGALVLGATVISGTAGYLVLIVAARALSLAENAAFLVFWGALFSVFGVLIGITTETARAVAARDDASPGSRVMPLSLAVVLGVALLLATSGLLWAPALFDSSWPALLAAVVTGAVLFGGHVSVAGAAAGTGSWAGYSLMVAAETSSRLVLCVGAAVAAAGVVGFAWAATVASGAWVVLTLASRRYRSLWSVRSDVGTRGLVLRILAACAASGISSLLLVGYPVLLRLTTPDRVFATAAPLVLAISLSRAPLLVPLGAYQNVVVTRVVQRGARALLPVVRTLAVLTGVGAVGAWLLGPWALRLVNPAYDVPGDVFAALMLAAGLVALMTLTGAATVGMDHHVVYLAGWIAATLAAVVVLLVPGSLEARVIGSLVVGPVVGTAVHVLGGLRRHRLGSPADPT